MNIETFVAPYLNSYYAGLLYGGQTEFKKGLVKTLPERLVLGSSILDSLTELCVSFMTSKVGTREEFTNTIKSMHLDDDAEDIKNVVVNYMGELEVHMKYVLVGYLNAEWMHSGSNFVMKTLKTLGSFNAIALASSMGVLGAGYRPITRVLLTLPQNESIAYYSFNMSRNSKFDPYRTFPCFIMHWLESRGMFGGLNSILFDLMKREIRSEDIKDIKKDLEDADQQSEDADKKRERLIAILEREMRPNFDNWRSYLANLPDESEAIELGSLMRFPQRAHDEPKGEYIKRIQRYEGQAQVHSYTYSHDRDTPPLSLIADAMMRMMSPRGGSLRDADDGVRIVGDPYILQTGDETIFVDGQDEELRGPFQQTTEDEQLGWVAMGWQARGTEMD
ncbi:MAG: hypothetical protein M1840_007851 [Geoglossum simile]|nr:MAG: hypothetical protein M1840_007851 [Geoglossum simile]